MSIKTIYVASSLPSRCALLLRCRTGFVSRKNREKPQEYHRRRPILPEVCLRGNFHFVYSPGVYAFSFFLLLLCDGYQVQKQLHGATLFPIENEVDLPGE